MQWCIQNSGVIFDALDNNVKPLVKAIDAIGDTRIAIGVIPFTDTIVGIEDIDLNHPVIFYGSTKLVEIVSKLSFSPGCWFKSEWFDPKNWVGKRHDLLNESQTALTIGELRKNWIDEPVFIKSIEPKILTGMVLEGRNDESWWIEEYSNIPDDTQIVLSSFQEIIQEWRFFIINDIVVTGSQYKHNGILRIHEPIPNDVWENAHRMTKDWMPSQNIVMDIARMQDGTFKIVEWNCLNSSGWYNSDISAALKAFNSVYF